MFWTCLETAMTVDTIPHLGKNYKCTYTHMKLSRLIPKSKLHFNAHLI